MRATPFDMRHQKLTKLAALPIVAITLFCLVMVGIRFCIPVPQNPWEAIGVVGADRFALGLPLYEDNITGQPQWMYGPGMFVISGLLFRITGPSLLVMETLSLIGVAAMILLAWAAVRPWLSPLLQFVALCSLVALESKIAYFCTARPDFIACALAFGAMILSYRGGTARILGAAGLLVASLLMKQTMIIFAILPPLACLVETGFRDRRALLLSIVPGLSVGVALLCMKNFAPLMWFYMIEVPRHFPIDRQGYLKLFFGVVGGMTSMWVALGAASGRWHAFDAERSRRLKWIAIGIVITVPVELLAYAKFGGTANSMIPAFVLMTCLSWLLIAPVSNGESSGSDQWPLIIYLLSLSFTFMPTYPARQPLTYLGMNLGGNYRDIISRVRTLDGSVISPDDPTITLAALGQHDRTLVVDLDALNWPRKLPVSLDPQYSTRYIVQKKNEYAAAELDLPGRGYRVKWQNGGYAIWERTALR